jgi:hypothetical protein
MGITRWLALRVVLNCPLRSLPEVLPPPFRSKIPFHKLILFYWHAHKRSLMRSACAHIAGIVPHFVWVGKSHKGSADCALSWGLRGCIPPPHPLTQQKVPKGSFFWPHSAGFVEIRCFQCSLFNLCSICWPQLSLPGVNLRPGNGSMRLQSLPLSDCRVRW